MPRHSGNSKHKGRPKKQPISFSCLNKHVKTVKIRSIQTLHHHRPVYNTKLQCKLETALMIVNHKLSPVTGQLSFGRGLNRTELWLHMLPCQEREALKLDSLGFPFLDHLNEFCPLSYLEIVLSSLWGCGIAIFI